MSIGAAIVASDTAPVREVIEHDRTGRLVGFFDTQALVNEVCTLLDDPDSRARLGANARAFAQAHYDLERICLPRQLEWTEQLAARRPRG
jgi:glycosyltransferase involved in cell wall biosynthesis